MKRQIVSEQIEDKYDFKAYEKAMEEYRKNFIKPLDLYTINVYNNICKEGEE